MDMEYDDILQTLCDVWEKVKDVMRKFAERLRELFGSLSKVVEPGKPIMEMIFSETSYRKLENSAPVKRSEYMMQRDILSEFTGIWKTKKCSTL